MKCGHERTLILSLLLPMAVFAQQSPDISIAARDEVKPDSAMLNQDPKKKKEPPSESAQFEQPPEVVRQFQPDYPSDALNKKQEGTVWINILVGETGEVVEAKVAKSEAEIFDASAIECAKRWTFKPALLKGRPVATWVTVPFRFKLYDGKEAPAIGPGVKAPEQNPKVKNLREEMPPADYVPYEKPPEAIKQVQAKYPAAAKKDNVQGAVWVKTLIDEQGKVAKVIIQKSDAEVLNQAAVDAVKQWVFKPAVMKGKPVAVWVSIPFRFVLAADKEKSPKK